MAVALILLLVAVGSVLFHIYSPWWWTPIAVPMLSHHSSFLLSGL